MSLAVLTFCTAEYYVWHGKVRQIATKHPRKIRVIQQRHLLSCSGTIVCDSVSLTSAWRLEYISDLRNDISRILYIIVYIEYCIPFNFHLVA